MENVYWFGVLPILAAAWIILLVAALDVAIILLCIARRAPSWGLVPVAATAVFLYLAGIDLLAPFRDHPLIAAACLAPYVLVCLGYAWLKVWAKSRQQARTNIEKLRAWLEQHGVYGTLDIPDRLKARCREWAADYGWPEMLKWRDVLREASWWALYCPIDALYWLGAVYLPELVRWVLERPRIAAKFEATARYHFTPVLKEYWQFKDSQAAGSPAPQP